MPTELAGAAAAAPLLCISDLLLPMLLYARLRVLLVVVAVLLPLPTSPVSGISTSSVHSHINSAMCARPAGLVTNNSMQAMHTGRQEVFAAASNGCL